jgi:transposase-like protein
VITELSVMEQRYQAVSEVEAGIPVVEVAGRFGVSRQAIHRWVARYRGGGLEALADRSKLWVPETVLAVVDLPLRRPTEPGMIRRWR